MMRRNFLGSHAPTKRGLAWLACVTMVVGTAATTQVSADAGPPPGFVDTLAIDGLTAPTAAAFAPDGRVFVAEKSGVVKVFDSIADTTPTVFADLREKTYDFWDRGLLGLAVDPGFPARPNVYVLYSHDAMPGGDAPQWSDNCPTPPGANDEGCVVTGRLSQLVMGKDGTAVEEKPLITDWCQQFPSHSIGTVAFGPDGALYASGGDGAGFNIVDYGQVGNPCADPPSPGGTNLSPPDAMGGSLRSQSPRRPADSPTVLNGTVIRVDPDTGDAMPGNPFADSTDANARRVIAYGLRNPFRFAFRPGTDELWVGDVGDVLWDEINRVPDVNDIVAENFGWPCFEGEPRLPEFDDTDLTMCESLYAKGGETAPYYAYGHTDEIVPNDPCAPIGAAIAGIAFGDDTSNYPEAYRKSLFFADSFRGCVWTMHLDEDGQPNPSTIEPFVTGLDAPVQLLTGPSGDLFYLSHDAGELRRISHSVR